MKARNNPYRFTVKTLGCKVNQYESESIVSELIDSGLVYAPYGEDADVVVINTCTVTGKASMQARQAIRKAVRQYPEARIVVTGCYAQTEPEEIEKIRGVHAVVGQSDKHKIPDMIRANHPNFISSSEKGPRRIWHDIHEKQAFEPTASVTAGRRTRPYLKIQDGCNAFCSYCIVPFARGRSRSMPVADVLDRIRQISSAGYYEIVLTGIHIGSYGVDLHPGTTLYDLLVKIAEETAIPRVRLSSIEPGDVTEDIVRLVSGSERFCRHFHIPLQSGDNDILKKMNRPYSREFFKQVVLGIREKIPDCGIGVDVMAGFPGETEAAFENTFQLIEELPVTYLHVFPFSPRNPTRASSLPDRVPPPVMKERCRKLRLLGTGKKKTFYETFMGKTVDVLIEEHQSGHGGILKGITSNYIPVLVRGLDAVKNQGVNVLIQDLVHENPESADMALTGSHIMTV